VTYVGCLIPVTSHERVNHMIKRFLITVQQTRNAHRRLSNTNLAMLIAYLCYCLRNIYLNNGTANISFASAVVVNRDRLNDIHIAL